MGINVGHWLGNAVKTAGKPFQLAGHALQAADGAIGKEIGKIPVVGGPLKATFNLAIFPAIGPAIMVGQVLDGKRIDRVVLGQLKEQLKDIKEVAPYAQMVISFVPGIGTGISAAIGAGLALADGQPITKAMEAGIKGAIPGGPIAVAAFDVAEQSVEAAAHHTKLTWDLVAKTAGTAAADLADLPDAAKQAMIAAFTTAGALTRGEKPDMAVADGALTLAQSNLPPAAAKALQVGVALAHAKETQAKKAPALAHPSTQNKLMAMGQQIQASDPIVSAARNTLKNGKTGFDIGIGVMSQAATLHDVTVIRDSLSPQDRQGFDFALSLHIGRVSQPQPQGLGPKGLAGYYATMGMQGAPSSSKTAAMTALTTNDVVTVGAKTAMSQVEHVRGVRLETQIGPIGRLWHWLKHFFTT